MSNLIKSAYAIALSLEHVGYIGSDSIDEVAQDLLENCSTEKAMIFRAKIYSGFGVTIRNNDRLYIESQLIEYGINIDKLKKHYSIEELYIAVEELK